MARVIFFASIREALGRADIELSIYEDTKISNLIDILTQEGGQDWRPVLTEENVRIAVNHEIVTADVMVSNSDEIAFFPPVTGG